MATLDLEEVSVRSPGERPRRQRSVEESRERDRRAHERHFARALDWLRSSRLRFGPRVSVVDLSAGGALVETSAQLRPGSTAELTITGRGIAETAAFQVLRCEVASLGQGLVYRSACVFDRRLSLLDRLTQNPAAIPCPGGAMTLDASKATAAEIEKLLQRIRTDQQRPDPPTLAVCWNKLVVRYLDGKLLKGFSQDFHPSRQHFHLLRSVDAAGDPPVVIPVVQVKAVFFVRDFSGDSAYVDKKSFLEPRAGRRIEVSFLDDEVMVGTTLNYHPAGIGFFLFPADPNGNNLRVFVGQAAVRHIRHL